MVSMISQKKKQFSYPIQENMPKTKGEKRHKYTNKILKYKTHTISYVNKESKQTAIMNKPKVKQHEEKKG